VETRATKIAVRSPGAVDAGQQASAIALRRRLTGISALFLSMDGSPFSYAIN
jgi:hypothetical protein